MLFYSYHTKGRILSVWWPILPTLRYNLHVISSHIYSMTFHWNFKLTSKIPFSYFYCFSFVLFVNTYLIVFKLHFELLSNTIHSKRLVHILHVSNGLSCSTDAVIFCIITIKLGSRFSHICIILYCIFPKHFQGVVNFKSQSWTTF